MGEMRDVVCPEHGPMEGGMFVDGITESGESFGEYRLYCLQCYDRDMQATHPYRGNEQGRRLRDERVKAGLALRETGDLLGVPWMRVNNVQTGAEAPPDDEEFSRWIEAIRGAGRGSWRYTPTGGG
jgi:hypothetical protein